MKNNEYILAIKSIKKINIVVFVIYIEKKYDIGKTRRKRELMNE